MKFCFFLAFCLFSSASFSQTDQGRDLNDIVYYAGADADTANHKVNLVIPDDVEQPPLLIWIGGGAWSYVDRKMEMDLARKIAGQGIAVASVGHRLSPATWKDPALSKGIRHPAHIHDIARAVAFLYKNAGRYGYSQKNIFIGGYSSGAHLSALIVMDPSYLENVGLSKNIIKGVLPIAGTYDIMHYHQVLTEGNGKAFADNHVGSVFGLTTEDFTNASPSAFLDNLSTPMLLVSETNTFKYTRLFENRLRDREFRELEVFHVHRMTHGELWKNLSYAEKSICRDLMTSFINRISLSHP
jgi:hypothetical protein